MRRQGANAGSTGILRRDGCSRRSRCSFGDLNAINSEIGEVYTGARRVALSSKRRTGGCDDEEQQFRLLHSLPAFLRVHSEALNPTTAPHTEFALQRQHAAESFQCTNPEPFLVS